MGLVLLLRPSGFAPLVLLGEDDAAASVVPGFALVLAKDRKLSSID